MTQHNITLHGTVTPEGGARGTVLEHQGLREREREGYLSLSLYIYIEIYTHNLSLYVYVCIYIYIYTERDIYIYIYRHVYVLHIWREGVLEHQGAQGSRQAAPLVAQLHLGSANICYSMMHYHINDNGNATKLLLLLLLIIIIS